MLCFSSDFWLKAKLQLFSETASCQLDLIDEMRLVIFGKDQLRKNCYLVSLKHIFVMGIRSTNYEMCLFASFGFGTIYPEKS